MTSSTPGAARAGRSWSAPDTAGLPVTIERMPHSPDLVPEAKQAGLRFDLALCGHTHGGQIALRGRSLYPSSRYGDRYRMGWVNENDSDIFITCGVGTSVLPMRVGTMPEIHRFNLSSGNSLRAGEAFTSSPAVSSLINCA